MPTSVSPGRPASLTRVGCSTSASLWTRSSASKTSNASHHMLNLTKLYGGVAQPADALRYGQGHGAPRSAAERRPIVVWNITRRCNLACIHCYSDSAAREYPG